MTFRWRDVVPGSIVIVSLRTDLILSVEEHETPLYVGHDEPTWKTVGVTAFVLHDSLALGPVVVGSTSGLIRYHALADQQVAGDVFFPGDTRWHSGRTTD